MTVTVPTDSCIQVFRRITLIRFLVSISSGVTFAALLFQLYIDVRSVMSLAIAFMCISIPALIMAPLASGIVQRLGPRLALLRGNIGVLGTMAALLWLAWSDQLVPWQLYVLIVIRITFASINEQAYLALTRALLPEQRFVQTSQRIEIADRTAVIIEPVLAGVGFVTIGLAGTIAVHVLCLLGFIVALLPIRVTASVNAVETTERAAPINDLYKGWQYISTMPGLLGIVCFFAITNIAVSMVLVLMYPLGLTLAPPWLFGLVLSLACLSPLLGLAAFPWLQKRSSLLLLIFGGTLLQGLILLCAGLLPSLWVFGFATSGFLLCNSIVIKASHDIWERKVPPATHRRLLILRRMIAWSTLPLGQFLAGLLADHIFVPATMPSGGALARTTSSLIGTGIIQGLGLQVSALGILMMLAVLIGYSYPRLRNLEQELPDIDERGSLIEATLTVTNAY